ncbi:MAG: hypothetical protein KA313_10010 [Pseudarcicella sp.]|nr:hypothetical protein [Pseudarcicella sp.]
MKKRISLLICLCSTQIFAQNNNFEGLTKLFNQSTVNGSARMQGIGGNHTAIGAELSNCIGNPAGLGQYTRSQIVLTPGFDIIESESDFLQKNSSSNKNNFNIANLGIVFSSKRDYKDEWRGTWALGYNRLESFHKNIKFSGLNDTYNNNILDHFVETVNQGIDKNKSIDANINSFNDDLFDFPDLYSRKSAHFWSLLVSPNIENGVLGVLKSERSNTTNQDFSYFSEGKSSQFSISYGGSKNEKLYLGFTLGIPNISYTSKIIYKEKYIENTAVSDMSETKDYNATASGLNLTVGAIYKPSEKIRFGASLHSGSIMSIEETISSSITNNIDPNKNGIPVLDEAIFERLKQNMSQKGFKYKLVNDQYFITKVPKNFNKAAINEFTYCTPYKANFGMAFFFGKKGFISGDVEYTNFGNTSFETDNSEENEDLAYELEDATQFNKEYFTSILNYKVGAEYKFGDIITRAGFNYQEEPFTDKAKISRAITSYSLGLGYRNDDFFIDIAGIHTNGKDFYRPYTLNKDQTPMATINQKKYRAVATIGVFF